MRPIVPDRGSGTLVQVIETLLDKGLVLNADIMVSVASVELLGIRIRAALASFETAARYGLEFPAGTNTSTHALSAVDGTEACPSCARRSPARELLDEMCPWCGWKSARAKLAARAPAALEASPPAAAPTRKRRARKKADAP